MRYRRRNNSDVWHFHTRCQHWPRALESTRPGGRVFERHAKLKPTTGELCNECRAKTRRDAQIARAR